MTICDCCRQPIDGDPVGRYKGEPVCGGCAEELQRSGLQVEAIDARRFGPDKHDPPEDGDDE